MRRRRDVRSGVVEDHGDGVRVVSYEPGNGTRYSVVLSRVGDVAGSERVLGDGSEWLVWVSNYSRGFVIPRGVVHYHMVQERLRCSVFDAVVIAELVGDLLQLPHVTVETYIKRNARLA